MLRPAVLAASASAAAARGAPTWLPRDFQEWAAEHEKQYGTEEGWQRALGAYRANEAVITELSADELDGAEYGHGPFSDFDGAEFKRQSFPGVMDAERGRRGPYLIDAPLGGSGADGPEAIDWREQGAVTPVKNQGPCGSCWAESAVGNMESLWYLANKGSLKAPVPLSVEQVVECDAHDDSCYGGYPKGAYQYVIENGGLSGEADYPYDVAGKTVCLPNQTFNATCGDGMCDDPPLTSYCDRTCSDKTHRPVAKIHSWLALPRDEAAMATYLVQHGPVSIGIDASGGGLGILFPWLQFYKRGVANPRRCTTTIDHGVLIVGMGEESSQKYWIIKNSWGAKWGESGYFRIVRGASKCGMDTMATSAVLASPGDAGVVVV